MIFDIFHKAWKLFYLKAFIHLILVGFKSIWSLKPSTQEMQSR